MTDQNQNKHPQKEDKQVFIIYNGMTFPVKENETQFEAARRIKEAFS